MFTYQDLLNILKNMDPTGGLSQPVLVYPPKGCPAMEAVRVTGISTTEDGKPILLTGKAITP